MTTPPNGTASARCTCPSAMWRRRSWKRSAAGPYELLLDLGAGTGRILELAAGRAHRLIGIDTNREMLKCARVRLDNGRARQLQRPPRRHLQSSLRGRQRRRRRHPSGAALPRQSKGGAYRSGSRAASRRAASWWSISRPTSSNSCARSMPMSASVSRRTKSRRGLRNAGSWLRVYRELQADRANENALTVAVWTGQNRAQRQQKNGGPLRDGAGTHHGTTCADRGQLRVFPAKNRRDGGDAVVGDPQAGAARAGLRVGDLRRGRIDARAHALRPSAAS